MAGVWRAPFGFSRYECSTAGEIRKDGVLLKPTPDDNGRLSIVVIDSSGVRRNKTLAALILLAHVGPPRGEANRVIQIDGDPLNCRKSNLKWGTQTEQSANLREHRPEVYAGLSHTPILNKTQAREALRNIKRDGSSFRKEAKRLGVARSTLADAVQRLRALPTA